MDTNEKIPKATTAQEQKADQEKLVKLADSLIAAGNALINLTKNVIPGGAPRDKK